MSEKIDVVAEFHVNVKLAKNFKIVLRVGNTMTFMMIAVA